MSIEAASDPRGDSGYVEHCLDQAIADALRFGRPAARKMICEVLLRHGFAPLVLDLRKAVRRE